MGRVLALLLDADGLIQHPRAEWVAELEAFAGEDTAGFLDDLWRAERPALEGRETLEASVARLLRTRGIDPARTPEICALWDNIEVDHEALALVARVRAAGVPTFLATNQQAYRRDLMLDLGYADLFDGMFFSCEVGHAKPDPAYFRAIVDEIGRGPAGVVFVDDRPDNVAAAEGIGLAAYVHDPLSGADGLGAVLRAAGVPGA